VKEKYAGVVGVIVLFSVGVAGFLMTADFLIYVVGVRV
jgi:hypothetical protein